MTDPVAPAERGRGVTFARGFTAGAIAAGVKTGKAERLDVALIVSDRPCAAAGVFTTNQVTAAPVVLTRDNVARGSLRAVVVNSGNANACTGDQGDRDAKAMTIAAASALNVTAEDVGVASTGVIGVQLPIARITDAIARIRPSVGGWDDFSRAIMTTDTKPKVAEREVAIGRGIVRIGGVAKGVGMVHPDMATVLSFLTTDASISAEDLRRALTAAARDTFNAISVDGDTSTNDTLLVLANGASGIPIEGSDHARFTGVLTSVCEDLARMIVADGEGATKVFEVTVTGARSNDDARKAARTVTISPLVKTAIHGADPNWGRIMMAVGRSGAAVDARKATVRIGDVVCYEAGVPRVPDLDAVRRAFAEPSIQIFVDLGLGEGRSRAWGCDLSTEYVHINADYTT